MNNKQLAIMLGMQNEMNNKVNPSWIKAGYQFMRAVIIEAAEAMEHWGWKWWKKQAQNLPQVQMELVDIWHFVLAHYLVLHDGDQASALNALMAEHSIHKRSLYFDENFYVVEALTVPELLELTVGLAVSQRFDVHTFEQLLIKCGLNWDSLYKMYVQKNVLNFFRQDHSYKEGKYIKDWQGHEDNEVLVAIAQHLNSEHPQYKDQLYAELTKRYIIVENEAAATRARSAASE